MGTNDVMTLLSNDGKMGNGRIDRKDGDSFPLHFHILICSIKAFVL